MPWCESCETWHSPNALTTEGTCPDCGLQVVAEDEVIAQRTATSTRVPWHFWLLLLGVTVYLGWRLVQGFVWIIEQF